MANKTVAWLVASGFVIGLAVCLGVREGEVSRGLGDSMLAHGGLRPRSTTTPPEAVTLTQPSAQTSNKPEVDRRPDRAPDRESLEDSSSRPESRAGGGRSPTSPSIHDEASAVTVIGRPFLVSSSVKDECKRLKAAVHDENCSDLDRTLTQMATQPRDPIWANKMEKILRDHVMTSQPGRYEIRNLECRTSTCAMETESPYGHYLEGHGEHEFEKLNGLYLGERTDAYERNEQGARVWVTLTTYIRR